MKRVYIIYNPNSTGNGKQLAEKLRDELASQPKSPEFKLLKTAYAGHAAEYAKQYAGPDTMLISSSGDGGFNELVNGVLESDQPDTIVGVLPGGNANDHYESRKKDHLVERIIAGKYDESDVLRVSYGDKITYAHSYVGFGLTADIGRVLTKTDLNPVNEKFIVARGLLRRTPLKILVDGQPRRYDSLVFAVSQKMSKVIHTGERPAGEFAIIRSPHRSLWSLISSLVRRSVIEPDDTPTASQYKFTTTRVASMQRDGETSQIPARTVVTIECLSGALREII